eukprot:5358527-Pyramimonas_sp.AAC.1
MILHHPVGVTPDSERPASKGDSCKALFRRRRCPMHCLREDCAGTCPPRCHPVLTGMLSCTICLFHWQR